MHHVLRFVLVLISLLAMACGVQEPDATSEPHAPTAEDVRGLLNSPELQRAVEERVARMERDNTTVEDAAWFGRTGLDDATERELPRYLRREFGEILDEPGALKASDLSYVGRFREGDGTVHYWGFPYQKSVAHAYVIVTADRLSMGWGDRAPPGREPE